MAEFFKIVALSVAAAILYGIALDQITARVCVEYFTIGHPPVFPTTSPTLLALGWGVIATWWAGLLVGLPAAICAQLGRWPKLTARELVRTVAILLVSMGAAAAIAGVIAYNVALRDQIWLSQPLADLVPGDKHVAFLADGAAHLTSYCAGFIGGIFVCSYIIRTRFARSKAQGSS